MNFADLKTELDKGKPVPYCIFSGEERYVMLTYVKRIAGDRPVMRFDTVENALRYMNMRNLFSQSILALVENDVTVGKLDVNKIRASVGKSSIITLFDKFPTKQLNNEHKSYHVTFDKFSTDQMAGYIMKRIQISNNAARVLAAYCGNDVARVENEMHKLKHYCGTEEVTLDAINEVVYPQPEDMTFDLVDALLRKQTQRVFDCYNDIIELGAEYIQLVNLMYSNFRQTFLVHSMADLSQDQIADKTHLTPYQVKRAMNTVGKYRLQSLLDILRDLQNLELEIKTGAVNPKWGFENMLYSIIRSA